jgi:hypothetical protein
MPSLTAYSCPQFAQASFPDAMLVSIRSVWRSLSVGVGSPSSVDSVSGAGISSGRWGRPSCAASELVGWLEGVS